jgi:biotin carboxyl carrier protein
VFRESHGALISHDPLCVFVAACTDATQPGQPDQQDSPLPVIQDLGITIATYDSTTNQAGDITFVGGETFIPFGKLLEGTNGLKRSPELTFFVELGTPVRAPITGVVSQIDVLYSDDYLLILRQSGSDWEVGVEHVVDPLVSVGDSVQAGQIIATATPQPTPFGTIAFTELAVWFPADTDEDMIKKCPYLAFDADLRQVFSTQIYALAASWEAYWGQDVFDEASWTQPGCVIDEMTEAEARNPGS